MAVNQPVTAFPADFSMLPTVSFVIPNLDHDMHDGCVSTGDTWLADHLGAYVTWAEQHNSLLVLTFDEDDNSQDNQIPTVVVGAHVHPGRYDEHVDHYRILATLESLPPLAVPDPTRLSHSRISGSRRDAAFGRPVDRCA